MSRQTKKAAPKTKVSATKKRAVAKKKPVAVKSATKATPKAGSFMWRLLERKQEELKRQQGATYTSHVDPQARESFKPSTGFGRFNGPRRRVG